jgi:hypothetical protein
MLESLFCNQSFFYGSQSNYMTLYSSVIAIDQPTYDKMNS